MALKLTFEQIDNGETFRITEASDADTNLTGASLSVTWDDTAYSLDLSADSTDVDSSGDWSIGDYIDVKPSDVGQSGDKFMDGVYKVEYNATNEDKVTYNTLLDYNVRLCTYNILRLVPDVHNCNVCSNSYVQRAIFMFTYLKSMEYSAAAGQITEIKRILLSLQNLCKNPYINECYSS